MHGTVSFIKRMSLTASIKASKVASSSTAAGSMGTLVAGLFRFKQAGIRKLFNSGIVRFDTRKPFINLPEKQMIL
jgi:hypothetical protein